MLASSSWAAASTIAELANAWVGGQDERVRRNAIDGGVRAQFGSSVPLEELMRLVIAVWAMTIGVIPTATAFVADQRLPTTET